MVISWGGGNYGHVAIVEDVYYDSNGNIESIDISEGYNRLGTMYNSMFEGVLLTNETYFHVGGAGESLSEQLRKRQYMCEGSFNGSTGTGCQIFMNIPVANVRERNGQNFICGIDLLS